MTQQAIVIYTDGGCKGNPGPGGWAYVMRFGSRYREAWGAEMHTTNNRMELTAVINALAFLKQRRDRTPALLRSKICSAARLGKRRNSHIHRLHVC